MNTRSFIAVIGVLALVGLLWFGLSSKGGNALAVGQQAPGGSLERLGAGGQIRIEDYRGHWTLVNFWASWCPPCRAEAPVLERFWREHRAQGITVVGIDLQDNSEDALDFVDRHGLTYPQLRSTDGSMWSHDYGMNGLPENFLLDPQGQVAVIWRGPVDENVLAKQFEPVIDGRLAPAAGS